MVEMEPVQNPKGVRANPVLYPRDSLMLISQTHPSAVFICSEAWLSVRHNLVIEENMCRVREGFIVIYLKNK